LQINVWEISLQRSQKLGRNLGKVHTNWPRSQLR
jgi:hypothetical protein